MAQPVHREEGTGCSRRGVPHSTAPLREERRTDEPPPAPGSPYYASGAIVPAASRPAAGAELPERPVFGAFEGAAGPPGGRGDRLRPTRRAPQHRVYMGKMTGPARHRSRSGPLQRFGQCPAFRGTSAAMPGAEEDPAGLRRPFRREKDGERWLTRVRRGTGPVRAPSPLMKPAEDAEASSISLWPHRRPNLAEEAAKTPLPPGSATEDAEIALRLVVARATKPITRYARVRAHPQFGNFRIGSPADKWHLFNLRALQMLCRKMRCDRCQFKSL